MDEVSRLIEGIPLFPFKGSMLTKYFDKLLELGVILLAKGDNENIGMAGFYANDMATFQAYLSFVSVRDDFRGKGVGTELLNKVCEISRSKCMTTIGLNVVSTNSSAIRFYEGLGFNVVGRGRDEAHFFMSKKL